jgi:hypothetical protein
MLHLLRSVTVNTQHVYAPVRSGHTDVAFTVANNTLSQGVRCRPVTLHWVECESSRHDSRTGEGGSDLVG